MTVPPELLQHLLEARRFRVWADGFADEIESSKAVPEPVAARIFRDVRLWRIVDGTSEIQKTVIARELLARTSAAAIAEPRPRTCRR